MRFPALLLLATVAGLIFSQISCKNPAAPDSTSTRTEIFPLAVGARWVYDYKYNSYQYLVSGERKHWEKGTVTFSVLSVTDDLTQSRWTVQERDSLCYMDTTFVPQGI